MEEEYYEEVPADYEDEEITGGDVAFIVGGVLLICIVLAIVMTFIRKTFRNFHVKIGDKIDIAAETKD